MIVILAAGAVVLGLVDEEQASFAKYRTCMLEVAEALSPSGEPVSTIELAAKSQCRHEYYRMGAVFAANGAARTAMAIANRSNGRSSSNSEVAYTESYDQLNNELSEDIANLIVKRRLESRTRAPNQ